MKKRVRKKLHKGEFQQFGMSLFVPSNLEDVENKLSAILDIADNNQILFVGGGFGHFSMPSEEYNDLDIPKKIETLITYIALSNETQLAGILGYFFKPFANEISKEAAEKVKSELETTLQSELKINLKIDLWN